ncbi:DUF4331 family protein [Microbacterium sp. NPDC089320]|uniref:DUF4331 family protein n=1 Tax=Microbacterium sp. NPDC089320 TaxID=3155182 RepID=UPI00341A8E41
MSDHISGPRALGNPIADITDVFAFPSPERPGHLVLVMNTLPFALISNPLSEGLIYRFRIRDLVAGEAGDPVPFTPGAEEFVVDCVFSEPTIVDSDGAEPASFDQEGHCTTPTGEVVSFTVGDERGGSGQGVRVFAGARWDPFFFDARSALKTVATGQLEFSEQGSIYLDGKNVLGLVVEIDAALLGGASVVGVVAETLTRGVFNVRIERVGRPEVKNMLLAAKQYDTVNRDIEIRDLYNTENAFHIDHGYEAAYRARLNANLAFWDGLDGKTDWPLDDGVHPLTEFWLADYLIVDVTKPYQERSSFLEIEMSARAGRPHSTCGGRAINDDAMDTFFTLLINGGDGPVIRDGIDGASRPASSTFPYLAPPNPDPPIPPEHH